MRRFDKRERNDEKTINKEVAFIVLAKNMRSMHSSDRIEEMICELEGYRWGAILLSETWKQEKAENVGDTNPHSWAQEDMTTNTALVSC